MGGLPQLVFLVFIIITAMVISSVIKAVKKAIEDQESGRQGGQPRREAASDRTPRDEVEDFVRVITGQAPARRSPPVQTQRPPQPPQRTAQQRTMTVGRRQVQEAQRARQVRRSVSHPATSSAKVVVHKPLILPDKKSEERRAPKTESADWIDRLPTDRLKQAVVLREVLGPPVALRRGGGDGRIARM